MEQYAPAPQQQKKNKGLAFLEVGIFEIFFAVLTLAIFFGVMNYFNILPISQIWPKQLGFLPHRPYQQSKQSNPVKPPLADNGAGNTTMIAAKQTLIEFLPTILTPSFLPQSSSDITLTEDRDDKDRINASWTNKGEGGGTLWAVFPKTPNFQKITSLDVFFEQIQTASPSVELAKSNISQVFSINPKGEWKCRKDSLNERALYCENFWEEKDSKRGLGFLIINTSPFRGRLVFSFCEHSKESSFYSWKSCRAEFATTALQ